MNDCQTCQNLFSEHLDNQLDATDGKQVEAHLNACRDCLAEWRSFSSTVSLLREADLAAPPAGILAGVHRKLAAEQARPGLFTRLHDWLRQTDFSMSLPTAAGTIAAALVAMLIVRDITEEKNFTAHQPAHEARATTSTKNDSPPLQQQVAATPQNPHAATANSATAAPPRQELTDAAPIQPLSLDQHLTELHWQFLADSFRYAPRDARITTVSTGGQTPADRQPLSFEDTLSGQQASFFRNFFQAAAQRPDVEITVKNCVEENSRLALCRKIINSPDWMARVRDGNTILLAVPPSKLATLNSLFSGHDAVFSPPQAREENFASPRKSILVAVRLQ